MTWRYFSSQPDPQDDYRFTRLILEDQNAHVIKLEMCKHPNVLYSIPAMEASVFTVQFTVYDLQENKLTDKTVVYSPDNPGGGMTAKFIAPDTIEYNNVPSSNLAEFPPINARLRFTAPAEPGDHGWLDLDIDFSCPPQYKSDPARYAWQAAVAFPRITVAKDATADGDTRKLRDYSLLMPTGDFGKMGDLGQVIRRMEIQFAALYKTETTPGNYAQGFALMATDTRGHHKDVFFTPQSDRAELACSLISPIHLKAKKYVQPLHPADQRYAFGLSQEDGHGHGFGGANTHYRLRVFRVESPHASLPADWRDVTNLYRNWVLARRLPEFFTKKWHHPSPLDNLSPHTVICNYSLDGAIAANVQDPNLPGAWLEVHPFKLGSPPTTDMPNNKNDSIQDLLVRIRDRVNTIGKEVRLEAQLWSFEMGGIYHYYGGYPPITNVLRNEPQRFQQALAQLAAASIFPCITTDPLIPLLNRARYRGHLRWVGGNSTDFGNPQNWKDAIQHPFPPEFKRPDSPLSTCGLIDVDVKDPSTGIVTHYDRVFIVKDHVGFVNAHPSCADVEAVMPSAQRLLAGGLFAPGMPLTTPFYDARMGGLCQVEEVERRYRDEWLTKVFASGVKVLEFMKVGIGTGVWEVCYNKEHQHIVPMLPVNLNLAYDNVIGFGPWAVNRLQAFCNSAHTVGTRPDPTKSNFSLTIEGVPPEQLLPYVNEFYHSSAVFQHVYAEAISVKEDLGEYPPHIHPGYRERRKLINNLPPPNKPESIARPDYMIDDEARDTEGKPLLSEWRRACRDYFNLYFEVASYGIAPRFYPTGDKIPNSDLPAPTPANPLAPADPLAPTNPPTYTYCRCVQDVFNLRARIFNVMGRAVNGERIYASSYIFEKSFGHDQPYDYYDYNEELVNTMTRAIQMQIRYSPFFRGGRMLGRTNVKLLPPSSIMPAPPPTVQAWSTHFRPFSDIVPFRGTPLLGTTDLLSLGFDKDEFAGLVIADRLPQMVWRKKWGENDVRYIYVFANVGNTPLKFHFQYARGIDTTTRWGKIIRVFDGRNTNGCDPSGAPPATTPTEVHLGEWEMTLEQFPLAARSFAVVGVLKY